MPDALPLPGAETPTISEQAVPPPDLVEALALNLARNLKILPRPENKNPLTARVKTLGTFLRSVHRHFDRTSRAEAAESHAAEWILDNFYIVEQALRQITENLPADFYHRLPKAEVNGVEMARIQVLAHALTRAEDSHLDPDQIRNFIQAFQELTVLRIGELWSLAPMLRLSVIELLADALSRIIPVPLSHASLPDLEPAAPDEGPSRLPVTDESIVVNSILSLRVLATQDWQAFFETTSVVENILCDDPAQVYIRMDFDTRNRYRNVVEELARGSSKEEIDVTREAIHIAQGGERPRTRHVGYYLVGPGRPALEKHLAFQPERENILRHWLNNQALPFYLNSIGLLTILLCTIAVWYAVASGGTPLQVTLALVLAFLPAWAAAVDIVNWLVIHIVPPRILPRLDFKDGIPAEFGAMVVIPSLLKNEVELEALIEQMEIHYLGNAEPSVRFALLTDFVDAPEKELPGEAQLMEQAVSSINQLNARYENAGYKPFYLFHRERLWNPSDGVWMGWERKRGKLSQFNELLKGGQVDAFTVRAGDLENMPPIRYVLTLDADTTLTRGSVQRLAGTLAHPLNQAEFDPETGQLVDGYTVLQPRVQVRPTVTNRSVFTRIYSGDTALDLYTRAVSDVYQDLFGEGSYVGKGMYDVVAFEQSLHDRVPDNMLLSHDLFEGIHGRCGLVTNVVLFEDYPPHYVSYAHRLHRWIRGDWQLLPWLMPRIPHRTNGTIPNDLSLLDRWKIFDNLRRSLTTPAILVLLIASWLILPGASVFWMTLALSTFILAILFGFIAAMRARRTDQYPETTSRPIEQAALRSLLQLIFLPHEAFIAIDAIGTTLVRLLITHKRMLQWVTAAHTVHVFGRDLKVHVAWNEIFLAPTLTVFVFILVLLNNLFDLVLALPFLLVWMASPYIAVRISHRISYQPEKLTPAHEKRLHLLARATWLYFEHFVGPDDHWLPPDHFQEDPLGLVAHRTSPTNIGLLLLSTLSAYDLGYIGPLELALRARNTFDGMDLLEKQRGHLLNWYDTRTLDPLPPRYISTVDSGNLAASLIVLRQGCIDAAGRPIIRWDGLIDTLDMLDVTLRLAHLGSVGKELEQIIHFLRKQVEGLRETREDDPKHLMNLFREGRAEMEEMLAKVVEASSEHLDSTTIRRLSTWIERTRHHLTQIEREMESLYPWPLILAQAPSLFDQPDLRADLADIWDELRSTFSFRPPLEIIPAICVHGLHILVRLRAALQEEQEAIAWCDSFAKQLETAHASAAGLLNDLRLISERAEAYIQSMNFGFLYDTQRKVFHIGYNVDSGRLDSSYYDLLASEARITSLLAIAKGDVPQNHWLYLSRPITQIQGMRALLSWSGTMFEYLMPALFTKRYHNTLLDQSCRAAVDHQIAYGQSKHVPWGISESSFYYFDVHQVYQYRAFGNPGLGFKRGLGEDLVIAPYASLLALPFTPLAVIQNLERFQKLNMIGLYGLYEAVDFTGDRLGTGQDYAVVRSYMAHHQGMILLSLCNHLRSEAIIQRFHADPRIETVKLLLQEQIPVRAPIEQPHPQKIGVLHPIHPSVSLDAWKARADASYRQVHFLSNGRYNLLITAAGSGYSGWRETDLTRWRADTTLDQYGSWIYVYDCQREKLWSAGHQPTAVEPERREVHFYPHTAEFTRRDGDISTQMQIVIAPNADVEIRRMVMTNHSESPRELVLTSFAEIILAPQAADQRHPAYNKLFIESEFLPEENILLFRRRPRSAQEKPVYLAHFVVADEDGLQIHGFETDRSRFFGRGHTARNPVMLDKGSSLSNMKSTLDPISSIQAEVGVPGYASRQIAFVTVAASSRSEALTLARRYHQWHYLATAFGEARTQAEHELTQLGLYSFHLEKVQKLLSLLLYPTAMLRSNPATLAGNRLGQRGLWSFAISGDYPILLVNLRQEKDLDLLDELLRAHTYWRKRGIKIDLVIMNKRETSYDQNFQGKIYRLLSRTNSDDWLGQRGGIFVLREDQMSEAEKTLLATVARVVLDSETGSLSDQLARLDRMPLRLPHFVPMNHRPPEATEAPRLKLPSGLLFDNGLGGFTPDGREYVIHLQPGQWTPAPWVNVIANPEFGFVVSESGMGCTWAVNSGENRLTPWHNDPVSDPPSEAIYLRDEDTGEIWSPTPLPARADAPYLIRHGMGYSIFEHHSHQLRQDLKIFAVPDAPLKIAQLKLKNTTTDTRRISVTYYAEWVLATARENMAQYILPEFAPSSFALLASNPYNQAFGKRVAFLAATRELQGLTTDRTEFLGPLGSYARPEALQRVGLTASTKPGVDPCAAIQLLLWLAPGETKEVTFLLGQGNDRADALKLIKQYKNLSTIRAAWKSVESFWEERIGGIQVKTPDQSLDLLVNRWLPYQALACRIWGRTAFYQSGGAFGFRDQLQDVMAFFYTRPEIAREHILNAARHQFEEGDVLHWWHPPGDQGIRTRITDNMLWLPYVTAQYVCVTGDRAILDEQVPFLSAEPLQKGENERYGEFPSGPTGSLFEHCRRALAKGSTSGPHGLPLMGEGDWNDGMNNVGHKGIGESIWLGWFLHTTLMDFARVCDLIPSAEDAQEYREQAERLRTALEASAWDGEWYRRAYYDDGKPLGSRENHDCQIDSISQSWSVISGAADPERARIAMESLYERLVRREDGLILLLTPPFDRTFHDPGYIKGYLPGVRENGGQYTHAALWAIWAFAELGQGDRAYELFRLINPIHHGDTPEKVARYQAEPYVIAADVYSAPAYLGRAGWTWYTGSASWMTRLAIEKILGLQREGNNLKIQPCIPKDWREYEIHYSFGKTMYRIRVANAQGLNGGVSKLSVDGKILKEKVIPLVDDGMEHEVIVVL